MRLTYKAYVEDEEDDKAASNALDIDISDDDESSDSDEPNGAYEESENESFMDVLAALIVSEEFQGIVASDALNTKLQNDATISNSSGTTKSRSRDAATDNKPTVSSNGAGGLAGNIAV